MKGLIKPVTKVFSKSNLWSNSLSIYEFEHEGPSRSGRATISVVVAPDDSNNKCIITYAHHEGASSYTLNEWAEYVATVVADTLSDEHTLEAANQITSINLIISDILLGTYS